MQNRPENLNPEHLSPAARLGAVARGRNWEEGDVDGIGRNWDGADNALARRRSSSRRKAGGECEEGRLAAVGEAVGDASVNAPLECDAASPAALFFD